MKNDSRRTFLRNLGFGAAALAYAVHDMSHLQAAPRQKASTAKPLNVLLITVDDMNCDSVGVYGCDVQGTTPNIDKLAAEGLRFDHAHVTIAVCQPCRGVLATGRYPHRSGIEGFFHTTREIPTINRSLKSAGYLLGILGKAGHSSPRADTPWDMRLDMGQLGLGRDSALYYSHAKTFFEQAKNAGKPFYLMANSHDPHRPFSGSDQEKRSFKNRAVKSPSRSYSTSDVNVPAFLPDLPEVRLEMAEYYSSVRRADDTVGAVLRALEASGQAKSTLVMFLSDHGMPLPFAKTNCYLHSTRTPWIVRWPGVTRRGAVDAEHFISCIDFLPTVLAAAGLAQPAGMDGFSFVPVLRGGRQENRAHVFTQFHETSARNRYPMRCIQNKKLGYIFNPWSDGKRVFRNESQSGRTFRAMQQAASQDPALAARVKLFQCRVREECYDLQNDPDALHNVINEPAYQKAIEALRQRLAGWMKKTGDPCLDAFLNRHSEAAVEKFMARQQAEADTRKRKKTRTKTKTNQNPRRKKK